MKNTPITSGIRCSEKELLYKHLDHAKENDLILMDRGYPGIGLFFLMRAKKLHFCVRMKDNWWLEVDKFNKSGKKEAVVAFTLPKKDRSLLKDFRSGSIKQFIAACSG